jgi:uncharacterized membrane protein YhhN
MKKNDTDDGCKLYVYIILDVLFFIFGILYMIGDTSHLNITVLRFAKPIPIWIMMAELLTVKNSHRSIILLVVGLAFGSLGDILLELQSFSFALFAAGALSFLLGHLAYVTAFLQICEDTAEFKVSIREVLQRKALYIFLWLLFLTFSFWSIGNIMKGLTNDSIMNYILPIYGAFLVLLVVSSLFFLFTTSKIGGFALRSGILFAVGSFVFYASDSFLAHGKFNAGYQDRVSDSANAAILMVTYYIAQYMLGKGGLSVAIYFRTIPAA